MLSKLPCECDQADVSIACETTAPGVGGMWAESRRREAEVSLQGGGGDLYTEEIVVKRNHEINLKHL